MEFTKEEFEVFDMLRKAEMNLSRTILDENLGLVFYPCENAIEEALERSMA